MQVRCRPSLNSIFDQLAPEEYMDVAVHLASLTLLINSAACTSLLTVCMHLTAHTLCMPPQVNTLQIKFPAYLNQVRLLLYSFKGAGAVAGPEGVWCPAE